MSHEEAHHGGGEQGKEGGYLEKLPFVGRLSKMMKGVYNLSGLEKAASFMLDFLSGGGGGGSHSKAAHAHGH